MIRFIPVLKSFVWMLPWRVVEEDLEGGDDSSRGRMNVKEWIRWRRRNRRRERDRTMDDIMCDAVDRAARRSVDCWQKERGQGW
jgi:hypothetical protein